ELGQNKDALGVCKKGRQLLPPNAELLFWEAIIHQVKGDLPAAEQCLLDLLDIPSGHNFMGFDAGLQGYRSRQFLGEIYAQQGKVADAENQWRQAVAQFPFFTPAWRKLGELWLSQKALV